MAWCQIACRGFQNYRNYQVLSGYIPTHLGVHGKGAPPVLIEGNLEVKLPTIWTNEEQSRAEAKRRERSEERRSEKRKSQKKEDADARKGRKVAKHGVFPMFMASEGR